VSAPRGLVSVARPALERLARLFAAGRLQGTVTESALVSAGLAQARDLLAVLGGLEASTARMMVEVALAERVHRPPPRLELVWTGPEAPNATARDTSVLVRSLFDRARQAVVIAGFRFDHGEHILAPLHAVMRDHGVEATVFMDLNRSPDELLSVPAFARLVVDTFLARNWPFGEPLPTFYYDPRPGDVGGASLHAKCIVIDEQLTLITSANFTDRGQTRNIELGALVEDHDFATSVVAQWRGLINTGLARKA
jgi:phosphatidylserine/phosphatidylglycerophosphate/cardiolipin synthase-like enzyme